MRRWRTAPLDDSALTEARRAVAARPARRRRFDCSDKRYGFPYNEEDAVPVNVKRAALSSSTAICCIARCPTMPHGYRRALVNHYMSAELCCRGTDWKKGRRVAHADYRDIIMIAGKDPYAWKGIEDISKPSVRPSGEGGCGSWGGRKAEDSASNVSVEVDEDDHDH